MTNTPPLIHKIPLVLFSGGIDSAHLLDKYLSHTNVDTLTINIEGQSNLGDTYVMPGYRREARARDKITSYLKDKHKQYGIDVSYEYTRRPIIVKDYYQSCINLILGIVASVDPKRHSEVYMGYVADDSWVFLKEQILAFYKSTFEIVRQAEDYDFVPLRFPLLESGRHKRHILQEIDLNLLDLAWWCETPIDDEPCWFCDSCVKHQVSLEYNRLKSRRGRTKYRRKLDEIYDAKLKEMEVEEHNEWEVEKYNGQLDGKKLEGDYVKMGA